MSFFQSVLGEIDVSCSPCRSRSRAAGGAVVIGTGRRSRLNSRIDVPSFLPGSARITTGVRKCFPGRHGSGAARGLPVAPARRQGEVVARAGEFHGTRWWPPSPFCGQFGISRDVAHR